MRLASVEIKNFRCIKNVQITFDAYTAFIGANGSGKSSILYALDWFFGGRDLKTTDTHRLTGESKVQVVVTFDGLQPTAKQLLGRFGRTGRATFIRRYDSETGLDT